MKNILYVDIFGNWIGGGQISLLMLLKKLNPNLYKPIVVCPEEGIFTEELRKNPVTVKIIPMGTFKTFNILAILSTILKFYSLMKRENIHLVHANGLRAAIYSGLAARLLDIPLVWHVRVMEWGGIAERIAYRIASKVIVNSQAVGRKFAALERHSQKVIVIYNGVDLDEFNPNMETDEIRKKYSIPQQFQIVGIIGELRHGKGQDCFLKAASQVIKQLPQVKFLVVGDGKDDYKNYIRCLAKQLNIEENVIFTGFYHRIKEVILSLDLLVHASSLEGFGRTIIEAQACAKPVVATNTGGVNEVIIHGETGILIPPEDPESMAAAIVDLLKNKDKSKRLGQAGRKRVEQMFSLEVNVRKTEQVYMELLQTR